MMFSSIADQVLCAPGGVLLAYLDPGSGSMLLQLSIAGLFSGIFFVKSFYAQIRESLDRLVKKSGNSTVG
jgi:hypothetical protein